MIKFGVELVPNVSVDKILDLALIIENLNFNYLWITDHYMNRNAYIILSTILYKTSKIKLGVGISNPYTTHPAWLASLIGTLSEISNGRVALGLGSGDKTTLESIGISREKPLTTVKEALIIVKKLLSGDIVNFEGEVFKLRNAKLNFTPPKVPIYIGAQAPKMLELAGQLGDGVLINASHPEIIQELLKHVKKGLEKSNRNIKEIDITACTCISIDSDVEKAKKAVKPIIAFIIAGTRDEILIKYDINMSKVSSIREELSRGNIQKAVDYVDDDMISYFSITGNLNNCLERIKEILKREVSHIVFGSPLGPKKKDSLKMLKEIKDKIIHEE